MFLSHDNVEISSLNFFPLLSSSSKEKVWEMKRRERNQHSRISNIQYLFHCQRTDPERNSIDPMSQKPRSSLSRSRDESGQSGSNGRFLDHDGEFRGYEYGL